MLPNPPDVIMIVSYSPEFFRVGDRHIEPVFQFWDVGDRREDSLLTEMEHSEVGVLGCRV